MARSVLAGAGHEAHDDAATVCEQLGSAYALTRRHNAESERMFGGAAARVMAAQMVTSARQRPIESMIGAGRLALRLCAGRDYVVILAASVSAVPAACWQAVRSAGG